jgi:hypothetical protein
MLQRRNGVGGVAGAEPRFEVEDPDPRVAGQAGCLGAALLEAGHAALRLQRVLRRDQPPDLVEIEALQRFETDVAVTGMGRVEGAAEEADASGRQRAEKRLPRVQGRTWPLPRTTYL